MKGAHTTPTYCRQWRLAPSEGPPYLVCILLATINLGFRFSMLRLGIFFLLKEGNFCVIGVFLLNAAP